MVSLNQLTHQQPDGLQARPSGRRIIAQQREATWAKQAADRRDQMPSVLQRDPTQDTVRDGKIEVLAPNSLILRQGFERDFLETDIRQLRPRRHDTGVFNVGRIEVKAPELGMRIVRGGEEHAQPVAAAQIGIAERRGEIGRAIAKQQ